MSKKPRPAETAPDQRLERLLLLAAVALAALVYVNALRGDFVYDDTRQIVENQLIQDGAYARQALTSDVWAFKGNREEAWSNYWRPGFVLWLMANYRLFGLSSTFGWHLANVLMHALVTALVFLFVRRLGLGARLSAAVAMLFAVHPVHVESVAWISGSPDVLLSAAFLGGLLCVLSARSAPGAWKWLLALLLAAAAMATKEIGIVFPAVVFVVIWATEARQGEIALTRAMRAGYAAVPFAVLGLVYFITRASMLGAVTKEAPWKHGLAEYVLTAPGILAFYLRQALFPLWIGPSYPLRVVTPDTIGFLNVVLPLVVVAAAAFLAWRAFRLGPVQQIGLAIFLLPLLPAFHINALRPEMIVHDRYLYLPVLGFLMVLVPTLAAWLSERRRLAAEPAARTVLLACALACVPLGMQTLRYNSAWMSEVSLWEWAVRSDPGSAFNWSQYGVELRRLGRTHEAKVALANSLRLAPVTNSLLTRAQIAIAERRFAEAETDLRMVLAQYPDNTIAYEQLAVAFQEQGRLDEAVAVLETGRQAIPHDFCAFTSNLAVLHYLAGRPEVALAELEGIRPRMRSEFSVGCRVGLFHLGQLHREAGRDAEAREAFQDYLSLTGTFTDARTQQLRGLARQYAGG